MVIMMARCLVPKGFNYRLGLLSLLSLGLVMGCGSPAEISSDQTSEAIVAPAAEAEEAAAPAAAGGDAAAQLAEVNSVPQRAPRLVKRANLVVQVDDMEAAIAAVETIIAQQQGDLLRLEDGGQTDTETRQVMLEMRVPQADLTATLAQLKDLGRIQQQNLTAEDVSSQLVDLEARVRNLRQSEAALLEIMERSGSIAEVLEVSRELSTVREAIERTEAQRQNLQGQVAFSTVTLTLETVGAPTPDSPPVLNTLGRTWQAATHSVAQVSIALLRLSLWLLAYSPYWATVVLLVWGYRRWHRRQGTPTPSSRA
jgi:hypothetical protein